MVLVPHITNWSPPLFWEIVPFYLHSLGKVPQLSNLLFMDSYKNMIEELLNLCYVLDTMLDISHVFNIIPIFRINKLGLIVRFGGWVFGSQSYLMVELPTYNYLIIASQPPGAI